MSKPFHLQRNVHGVFSATPETVKFVFPINTIRALLRSPQECDEIIRRHQVDQRGYSVGSFGANYKNEDTWAVDRFSQEQVARLVESERLMEDWAEVRGGEEGEYMLASVWDGHGGSGLVSELLKRTMHACLFQALGKIKGKENRIERIKEAFSQV